MENEIRDIIATRKFSRATDLDEITVVIGKPTPFPDSDDYYTPYQIVGFGGRRIRQVGGVDSVQSLQLAMKMIGHDLAAINRRSADKLIWDGDESGDLGFP